MVAIVAGNGVGLSNTSLALLGQGGVVGDPQQGRALDGVYVNAATGNLAIQRGDENLAGVGSDIALVRTYNSLGQLVDDNADNWQPGLYKKVFGLTGTVSTAGSTITRRDADGTEIVYTYDVARSAYVATDGDGAHDTLSFSSGTNTWTWTDGSTGATETYDNANGGRITNRKDTDLNTLTYTYNASSLITQVASSNGEITYLDYTGTKLTQIRTVTNAGATTLTRVRYGYDASNRLSTVTVDLSPADNSIADGKTYVTTYTYDSTSTRVASIQQSDGSRVDFTYTLVGSDYRITQIKQDPLGLNRTTTIAYNTGTRQTTITDPLSQATVITYDTSNRLSSVQGPAIGAFTQTVSYAYDTAGNVASVTDPRGNITVYQYDTNGNRTLERDAAGNTVTRLFSAANQLLNETAYLVPDPDGAGAGQPSSPATARYAYDSELHMRFALTAEGRVTEYRYNAAGQRIQAIQYTGAAYNVTALTPTDTLSEATLVTWTQAQDLSRSTLVTYTYDVRGQLASSTRYAKVNASGQGLADGSQSTTQYVYDPAGSLLSTVDPRGVATTGVPNDYVTSYAYDGLGRLTLTTDALGNATVVQYDDANRKTVTTSANGLLTTSTYDRAGELISLLQADGAVTLGERKYFYDANGRLRMVQDPTAVKVHALYDALGRKVADVDGDGSLTEYVYNPNNQTVSTIRYANAVNLALLVDGAGNPTSVALSAVRPATSGQDRRVWAIYDTAGRVLKTIDETGAVAENIYDGRSQLVKTVGYATLVNPAVITASTLATDAAVSPTASPNDRITRYFYDNDQRRRGVLDAEGYLCEYRYDAAGQLTDTIHYATSTNVALRATGSLAALIPTASADDIHTYKLYNASGQLVGDVDAEGYLTEYIYDLAGNRTSQIRYATKVNPNYLTSRAVTLTVMAKTSAGAISAQVKVDGVAVPGSPVSVAATSFTAYNFTVTLVSGQNHTVDVVFTDAGPDLSVQSITLDGQAIQATDPLATFDAGTGAAAFDGASVSAGQVLLTQSGALRFAVFGLPRLRPATSSQDQTAAFAYDALNRVFTETNSEGTVTQYAYDNVGNLSSRSQAFGTAEVRTLTARYDRQGHLTAELTGEGSALLVGLVLQADIDAVWNAFAVKHTYDAAGRRTSTTDANGNRTRFYYDADGRLTHTVNALGEIAESKYNKLDQLTETVNYTLRFSAATLAGLQGGLADSAFIALVNALASATTDSHRQLQYDLTGRVSTSIDALSHSVTRTYNAFGEQASRTTQVDATHNLTEATTYDHRGLATQVVADPTGINIQRLLQYDAFGRMTQETDGNGNLTKQTFDRLGRVVQVRDGLDKPASSTYDAFNRVFTQTDRLGNVTTYTYNSTTRSVQVVTQEGVTTSRIHNRLGDTTSQVSGNGNTTTFVYDKNGNLLQVANPIATTSSRYDAANRLIETTDANGVRTAYTYDAADRLASRTVDPQDALKPNGLNLVTNYRYDGQGRTVWTQDPNGVWTQTDYDMQGQVTAVTLDPKRSPNWVSGPDDNPNGLALRTTYSYDYRGKTLDVTEGAGTAAARLTRYTYDNLGRRIQETVDPAGLNLTTSYSYDKNNNVTAKTDAAGKVTRYYYDAEDRLIYTLDPLNELTQRVYNDGGLLIRVVASANALTGLPAQPTLAQIQAALVPNPSSDQTLRTIYDRDGREVFTLDALGYVIRKEYDANSNVVKQTRYVNGVSLTGDPTLAQVLTAIVANAQQDRVTKLVYDAADRLRYSVDALGYVTETQYDPAGHILTTILRATAPSLSASPTLAELDALYATAPLGAADRAQRFEYDAAGRLTRSFDAEGYSEQYIYDAAGNKVSFTNKNGAVWTYGYDADRRLISERSPEVVVTAVGPSGAQLAASSTTASLETRIAYDALGNVVSRTEAYGRPEARLTRYFYDAAGRQTSTELPQVDVYNAAGDDLTTNGSNGTVTRFDTTVIPKNQVVYDALGRAVVSKDVASNHSYKVYDALGQVLYDVDAEHYVSTYTYDAFGNKLSTTRYATAVTFSDGLTPLTASQVSGWLAGQTAPQHAADRVIVTAYDRLNRAITVTEPIAYNYDSNTDTPTTVARSTTNLYNRFGEVIKQTVGGAATYFYFDRRRAKLEQVDPMGYVTTYQYNAGGNLTRQVEYAKALTAAWNETSAPTATITTPATDPASAIGFDREVTYQYDRKDQKIAETRVGVQYSTLGSGLAVSGSSGNLTTTFAYDGVGNVVRRIDATGASTYTYYDALGRTIATAEPTRDVNNTTGQVALPPVRSEAHYLGFNIGASEVYTLVTSGESSYYIWTGSNQIQLSWGSLADYGDGSVRVLVSYASTAGATTVDRTFGGDVSKEGVGITWNGSGALRGITGVSRVQVWKTVDGQAVLVYDRTAAGNDQRLTFQKTTLSGVSVALRYQAQGAAAWTNATLVTEGNLYTVNINSLPADIYKYELTYTKVSDGSILSQGDGSFRVQSSNAAGSLNASSFVDARSLSIASTSAAYQFVAAGESGSYQWVGTNSVSLGWAAMDNWQGGTIRVIVDYWPKQPNGTPGTLASYTADFDLSRVRTGVSFSGVFGAAGLYGVSRVRVQRYVTTPATATTIIDRTTGFVDAERLILQGNTTGITSINIVGVGTRTATSLGAGISAVDLSGLARGTYQYTVVGNTSAGGSFEIKKSVTPGTTPVIQEKAVGTGWQLAGFNIPSDATAVQLQYRKFGDTGPYFAKGLTKQTSNEWTAAYDDLVAGKYEYQLVVSRPGGPDPYTGTLSLARGANLTTVTQSASVAQTLTPLTVIGVDAFGTSVSQMRLAKGAASVSTDTYTVNSADAADQITLIQRDSHGLAIRTQDAEGKSSYASYDLLGHAAKEWAPFTDNDGRVENVVRVFHYDKLGHQIDTVEPSFLPNRTLLADPATQALEAANLSYNSSAASWTQTESGWQLSGSNTVNVSWSDMTTWGGGSVQVIVDFTKTVNPVTNEQGVTTWTTQSDFRTVTVGGGSNSAVVSWSDTNMTSITRVRVSKYDVSGTLRLIHDTSSWGNAKVWTSTQHTNGDGVLLQYRAVGTTTWIAGTVRSFGSKYMFDPRTLAAGNYEYEVLYTRPSELVPYSRNGGTFTVNGTLTMGSAATSYTQAPLDPVNYLRTQARYNAFGEITAKGINDGWQETFEYDNAGRLWRTNQGDGVSKVTLYDVQGRATAEIRGRTTDLGTVANAQAAYGQATAQAPNPPTAVTWTRTKYDALGRATQQIQPSFVVTASNAIAPRGAENLVLSFGYSSATWTHPESGWVLSGSNSVSVSWSDMTTWGTGSVEVIVDFTKTVNPVTSESGVTTWTTQSDSRTVTIGGTSNSAVLSWSGTNITSITRVRVSKYDVSGIKRLIHDRASSSGSPYWGLMSWKSPDDLGTQIAVQTSLTPGGTYTNQPVVYNFGKKVVLGPSGVTNGTTYYYRITYTLPFGLGTWVDGGTFVPGATIAVTNDPAAANSTYTPIISQTLDRWGNVLTVTDPRNANWITTRKYNDLNEEIQQTSPQVEVWAANGTMSVQAPVTLAYYDQLGRRIASKDANNNLNTLTLDAAGQVVKEWHADGGQINYTYDAFGRKTKVVDALAHATVYTFDRRNRLLTEQALIGTRSYVYDELDHRIRETDATNFTTRYWYDTRGKVIQTSLPAGQQSAAFYDLRGNKVKDIDANGNVNTWAYDYFGRVTAHTDMGGKAYTYTYDPVTKQITAQTSGWTQSLSYGYYEDGKLRMITDNTVTATTLYEYDAAGNRTRERYAKGASPTTYQDARITFDALGRMSQVVDVRYTTVWKYDANGNRRNINSQFLDTNLSPKTVDNWYTYDSMNRITLSQGVLTAGVIQIRAQQSPTVAAQGTAIVYDAGGNRHDATFYEGTTLVNEVYNYDLINRLLTTTRGATTSSARTYDDAGRVTLSTSYNSAGAVTAKSQNIYNTNGWLTQTVTRNGTDVLQSVVNYAAYDNVGNVRTYTVDAYTPAGAWAYQNTYTYAYEAHDSYLEKQVSGSSTSPAWLPGYTTTTYDANGNITQVVDTFATNKTRTFVDDQAGHILQKTENGQTQNFFYASDNPVGSSGIVNSSGTVIVNPDFDYNYTPVSDRYPASTPGSYVVALGDTLRSIAMTLFGDASLWYIIADANGLAQDTDLIVGKALVIPNKITNLRNSYDVHKPYNAKEIIGDTTPTLPDAPPPPGDDDCGGFGRLIAEIIIVAVQIIVTYYTGSPVLGNIAGQAVGMILGVREDFSWKEVAIAWATQGLDKIGVGNQVSGGLGVTNEFARSAIASGVNNALVQGVSIAVGAQDKFDWKSVAAAAISAPLAKWAGQQAGDALGEDANPFVRDFTTSFVSGTVRQGVSILVHGGGKMNWASVASDSFGNALGNAIVSAIESSSQGQQTQSLARADEDIRQPIPPAFGDPELWMARLAARGGWIEELSYAMDDGEQLMDDLTAYEDSFDAVAYADDASSGGLLMVSNPGGPEDMLDLSLYGGGEGVLYVAPVLYGQSKLSAVEALELAKHYLGALDEMMVRGGNALPDDLAERLGLVYGALRGAVKAGGDVAELTIHALNVAGNKLGNVSAADAAASYQYFEDLATGLKALKDDPAGTFKAAFGDRFSQIGALRAEGKVFESAAVLGELGFDAITAAAAGAGVARGALKLTSAAARAGAVLQDVVAVRKILTSELGLTGTAASALAGDLPVLARSLVKSQARGASGALEAQGVAYAYKRMTDLGYKLVREDFIYNGSGHGLDMVFEKGGRYAVVEAKNGSDLGLLKNLKANGSRQGSKEYIKYQLQEYLSTSGANSQIAKEMLGQIKTGELQSFASLRGSERLVEFDLTAYRKSGNLGKNVYKKSDVTIHLRGI